MKPDKIIGLAVCLFISNLMFSQNKVDSLGLPGDNFDLYGALDVFKKAKTPEEFEKAINLKDNEINNLDLDGDGKTDYVKVIDRVEKNGHTLVMQVAVSETETQDVAVLEIEKTGDEKAHVQIVGNEELYGKDYILEPADQVAANSKSNLSKETKKENEDDVYSSTDDSNRKTTTNDNNSNTNTHTTTVVNVWGWPSVQYIYHPAYVVYVSPWHWRAYPVWWDPWAPIYWRYHYRRAYRYHYPYYHRAYYYRSPEIHSYYYGRRSSSGTVQRNRESGFYRERQAEYRKNAKPGDRYNNRPARDNNGVRDNNTVRPQRNNENRNSTPRRVETQPKVRDNNTPKQNVEPRQPRQNTQPKPNVQPRQPRMQTSPAPQRQGGGNRGGGGNGGGGRRK